MIEMRRDTKQQMKQVFIMPESLPLFLSRLLLLLLLLVTAVFTTNYLRIGIARVLYPYDLDFIEDGMLMQSWQVAQEQPVFVPPNADFVPQVYMPFYTWLGGQFFKVTGPVFWPLRLLSLSATLATAVLLATITRQESGDKWLAFMVAGLFLAGYRLAALRLVCRYKLFWRMDGVCRRSPAGGTATRQTGRC